MYYRDTIVYVGKSHKCAGARINQHTSPASPNYKQADKVELYHIKNSANIDIIEVYLINKYKPKYNKDCNSLEIPTVLISNLDKTITKVYTYTLQKDSFVRV